MKKIFLLTVIYFASYYNLTAQCALACNDEAYLFFDALEGTVITPNDFLEGDYSTCEVDFEVKLELEDGTLIQDYASSISLSCAELGRYLYTVRNAVDDNTCWGFLTLSNFTPPVAIVQQSVTVALENGSTTITAFDFDNGSYGVCDEDLRFTFSDTPPSLDPDFIAGSNTSSMVLSCDILDEVNENGVVSIPIFVWSPDDIFNVALTEVTIIDAFPGLPDDLSLCVESEQTFEGVVLHVKVDNFTDISTFQFSIAWNPEEYVFSNTFNESTDINNPIAFSNFDGVLNLVWIDFTAANPVTLDNGTTLFSVELFGISANGSSNYGVDYSNNNVEVEFSRMDGSIVPVYSGDCACSKYVEGAGGEVVTGDYLLNVNGACMGYELNLNDNPLTQAFSCTYGIDEELLNAETNTLSFGDSPQSLNGVSTLDLVFIIRGLLDGFETPLAGFLADYDGNLSVATDDLVLMRRLILGLETGEGFNQYRVVPSGYSFPADFDPFNITESFLTYDFALTDIVNNQLTVEVYKSGDLNNSAAIVGETIDTRESKELIYENPLLEAGVPVEIQMSLDTDESISGTTLMFALQDANITEVISQYDAFTLMSNIEGGNAKLSYLPFEATKTFEFSMVVVPETDGYLSDILDVNPGDFNEMVDGFRVESNINYVAKSSTNVTEILTNDFATIYPQPANHTLHFEFSAEITGQKNIELYDLSGRKLVEEYTTEQTFSLINQNGSLNGLYIAKVIAQESGMTQSFKVIFNQ